MASTRRWSAELAMVVLTCALLSPAAIAGDDAAAPPAGEDAPRIAAPIGATVSDPFEGWNRAVFRFNRALDRVVLRPLARGYRDVVPAPVRDGVSRFLDNLENPMNMVNNLLQGKPVRAGSDLARFAINSTLGLAGVLDPASSLGLTQSDEDFGQTLGRWGVGAGPYLLLPFLPPKTLRELAGEFPDARVDPFTYLEDETARYGAKFFDFFEQRYRIIELDEIVDQAYDPYVFVRNAYLERRAYKVRDGAPLPDDGSADELYEDPAEAEGPPVDEPPPY